MNDATNGDKILFSLATEQLALLCGPKMPLTTASNLYLDPRRRTATEKVKTTSLPKGVTLSPADQLKLMIELNQYSDPEQHAQTQVYIQLDAIKLKSMVSTDPFSQSICPYCATNSKVLVISVEDVEHKFPIIEESRGGANFFRIILKDHSLPRATALVYMEALQLKYRELSFFIPVSDRYGCCVLRAVRTSSDGNQATLNRVVLSLYSAFEAIKMEKGKHFKVKWPIIFPLKLLNGKALTIAETVIEVLSVGSIQLVQRVRAKFAGKNLTPATFTTGYFPDSVLEMMATAFQARKAKPGDAILMFKSYSFEGVCESHDISRIGESYKFESVCLCGHKFDESKLGMTEHFAECKVHLEKGLVCLCGDKFTGLWAYSDHVQGCSKSIINKRR